MEHNFIQTKEIELGQKNPPKAKSGQGKLLFNLPKNPALASKE